MTSVVLDSGETVTVPSAGLEPQQPLASALTAAREEVLDSDPTGPEEAVAVTLRALERHLHTVSLPDILECQVLIDTNASHPETAFIDTTEQVFERLDGDL